MGPPVSCARWVPVMGCGCAPVTLEAQGWQGRGRRLWGCPKGHQVTGSAGLRAEHGRNERQFTDKVNMPRSMAGRAKAQRKVGCRLRR